MLVSVLDRELAFAANGELPGERRAEPWCRRLWMDDVADPRH